MCSWLRNDQKTRCLDLRFIPLAGTPIMSDRVEHRQFKCNTLPQIDLPFQTLITINIKQPGDNFLNRQRIVWLDEAEEHYNP